MYCADGSRHPPPAPDFPGRAPVKLSGESFWETVLLGHSACLIPFAVVTEMLAYAFYPLVCIFKISVSGDTVHGMVNCLIVDKFSEVGY